MKNVDMPVLANLDPPRRVHLKKRPAAPAQGLFFAAQKNYFDGVEKNPRSAPGCGFGCLEIKCLYAQVQHQMFLSGLSYTDFVVFLLKESCIVRVKKDDDHEKKSVPLLEHFHKSHVIQEMLNPQIIHSFVAKEVLVDIMNNVVKNAEAEYVRKELDQLTMLSSTLL